KHLGHLGVGLEEGFGGDAQVKLAQALGQFRLAPDKLGLATGGGLRERGGACPQHTAERVLAKLGDQRRGKRADLQLAVGADEANLKLAAVATFAHHEVAQERSPVGGRTGALLTRAAHILATVRVGRLLLLLGPGAPAAWPTSATPRMQSL